MMRVTLARWRAERALVRLLRQPVAHHRNITISTTAGRWSVAVFSKGGDRGRGATFAEAWGRLRDSAAGADAIARASVNAGKVGKVGIGEALADLIRARLLLANVRCLRRKVERIGRERGIDWPALSVASLAGDWRKRNAALNASTDESPEADNAAGADLQRIEATLLATPILSPADATAAASLLADSLAHRLSLSTSTEAGIAAAVRDWLATV